MYVISCGSFIVMPMGTQLGHYFQCWCYDMMATLRNDMSELSFGRVDERTMINIVKQQNDHSSSAAMSSSNDIFTNVDPDINLIKTGVVNQGKIYDSKKNNDCISDTN